jgi:hypothetical protein
MTRSKILPSRPKISPEEEKLMEALRTSLRATQVRFSRGILPVDILLDTIVDLILYCSGLIKIGTRGAQKNDIIKFLHEGSPNTLTVEPDPNSKRIKVLSTLYKDKDLAEFLNMTAHNLILIKKGIIPSSDFMSEQEQFFKDLSVSKRKLLNRLIHQSELSPSSLKASLAGAVKAQASKVKKTSKSKKIEKLFYLQRKKRSTN